MKNITFSADEHLIDRAREKAHRENRSLNDAFRDWLATYSGQDKRITLEEIRKKWKNVQVDPPYSRDEMNERG